ncbi:MAG TPA: FAD-dependent oxidoreductase [Thermoanaerobaculia bacterium]|nr:FAD-dependent oxidoreductase [Thermoanaerobaculia bacterium]
MDSMIERNLEEAESRTWDLLVVGGGIYGATLALEAARRGLAALVVERGGFGKETTWNSLRIVHGGLRYLQSLDLPRFRESVRERRWFLRHFPDLVRPLPCLMPLYDPPRGGALRRPSVFRMALRINDLLSRERALPPGRLLSVAETEELFPTVDRAGLRGGALWHDAVAPDPRRLVIEILRRACRSGSSALERVEALEMLVEQERAAGIRAVDRESGRSLTLRARSVVNCAGPWCGEVARRLDRRLDRDIPGLFRPALAFNLLLDREPLSRAALAVAAGEPRAQTWFLLPSEGKLLAGTAYAPVPRGSSGEEGPDEVRIGDFLAALNAALPGFGIGRGEVLDVLWGRLPARTAGGTVLASRPVVFDHGAAGGPEGLLSVSGVKLTTARAVAERALAVLSRRGGRPAPSTPLPGKAAMEGRSA